MATPARSDKTMSSRLLTMKFMQRAAASSPASSPSTPAGPPSKRQRLSNGTATPTTPTSDLEAVQAALAAEELRRTQAIERQAAEAGETRWVLSVKEQESHGAANGLRVVSAGFGAIDGVYDPLGDGQDDDVGNKRPPMMGRKSFGKGSKGQNTYEPSSDSSNTSTSDDEEDDPSGTSAMIRAERKAKRKAAQAEAAKLAESRRKKEVKLNTLTSISGGGGGGGSSSANIQCYNCGEKGHTKNRCPKGKRR